MEWGQVFPALMNPEEGVFVERQGKGRGEKVWVVVVVTYIGGA